MTRNSYERLAEGVPYYVYFKALLLQPLKILSKRLESNDCALFEYPILINSIYKYYDQLSKQYALHDEIEEIRNCIEWRIRNTARYELIQTSFYLTPLGRIEIMNKRNTEHRYKDFYSPVSPITPIHIINPGIKTPDEYVLDDTDPNEVINPGHILNQDINELVGPKMFPNRIVEDDEDNYSVLDQEIDHYVSSIYNMIDLVSILLDDLNRCITKTSNDEDQEKSDYSENKEEDEEEEGESDDIVIEQNSNLNQKENNVEFQNENLQKNLKKLEITFHCWTDSFLQVLNSFVVNQDKYKVIFDIINFEENLQQSIADFSDCLNQFLVITWIAFLQQVSSLTNHFELLMNLYLLLLTFRMR